MKKLSERDEKTTTTTITEKKKLIKRAGVWFVGKKKEKQTREWKITIAVANTKMQMGC
jgi:hypothetical protein